MTEILDKKTFEECLKNEKVIITFYTKWCPICKMLKFSLEEYSEEHDDIVIAMIDFSNFEEAAKELGVNSVPTSLFYINGNLVEKLHGKIELDEIDEIFYH